MKPIRSKIEKKNINLLPEHETENGMTSCRFVRKHVIMPLLTLKADLLIVDNVGRQCHCAVTAVSIVVLCVADRSGRSST